MRAPHVRPPTPRPRETPDGHQECSTATPTEDLNRALAWPIETSNTPGMSSQSLHQLGTHFVLKPPPRHQAGGPLQLAHAVEVERLSGNATSSQGAARDPSDVRRSHESPFKPQWRRKTPPKTAVAGSATACPTW